MIKLMIDNIALEVPEGTTVLEAAQSVDIMIPHFCWHPALGNAGACRVCAVKMLDGPVKGIQMSCMLPVQDGHGCFHHRPRGHDHAAQGYRMDDDQSPP